ncbi:MAG: archease [Candidatus Rokuibacteriota bacterium]
MELTATGATLSEAFARIALALFAAAVDPATVGDGDTREVRAHGVGPSALLQAWLQECLYVHEVEGFACRAIEFAVFETTPAAGGEALRLHAILRGEEIDPSRHPIRTAIRNVSGRGLAVENEAIGFRVRAILDV